MKRLLLAFFLLCGSAQPAFAIAACTATATGVGFGTYDVLSATPKTNTGTVTVSCSLIGGISLLVAYDIQLSAGSGGNYTARGMKSGLNNTLNYNLYTTGTYGAVWGDGSNGSSKVSDGYLLGLLGATTNYTVYGRIPATQNVAGGVYTDTIIVTVVY